MIKEVWKSIPGYKYYEASNLGRIRSVKRKIKVEASLYRPSYFKTFESAVLVPWISTLGNYEVVALSVKSRKKNKSVHTLVCLAFNGLPPNKNLSNALHKNGKSTDNRPNNLYWGSLVHNWDDMRKHGKDRYGEKHPLTSLTLKQAQKIYDSRVKGVAAKKLSSKYGISVASICDIYKGRTWPQIRRR